MPPAEHSITFFYGVVAVLVAALFAVLAALEWYLGAAVVAAALASSASALLFSEGDSDSDQAGGRKRGRSSFLFCSPEALADRQRAAKDAEALVERQRAAAPGAHRR